MKTYTDSLSHAISTFVVVITWEEIEGEEMNWRGKKELERAEDNLPVEWEREKWNGGFDQLRLERRCFVLKDDTKRGVTEESVH